MKTLWTHLNDDVLEGRHKSRLTAFLAGAILMVAGAACVYAFHPGFNHAAYAFCAPAVVAAAALGGLWPGLAGTMTLIAVATSFEVQRSSGTDDLISHAILTAVSGIVFSIGAEALRRQRIKSDETLRMLGVREAHLQLILDTVPDAMIVSNEHGVIQSFSTAAERMFGWQAEEVLGQSVKRLAAAADASSSIGLFLEPNPDRPRAAIGLKRDGSQFPLELKVAGFRTSGKQFFTAFVHDRSALDAAERKHAELRTELVYAWRKNSVGEMASLLAHEINQPLAAITNYLGAARKLIEHQKPTPERVIQAVERAEAQAHRAADIIRSLRKFVERSDDGQKRDDLRSLISELDSLFKPIAREALVRVEYAFDDGANTVHADRIQIQQVVVNLVRNAIDALQDAPRRLLRISTSQSGGEITVRVDDSGPGIDPDLKDRLFLPLRSTKANGMGVGLSISRTIIEAHRGRIWAERSPLGGASFCFTLIADG